MAVERRADSKFWYGRWQVDKIRYSANLKVPVRGKPGSDAYELSKLMAEDALAKLKQQSAVSSQPEDTLRAIHKIRHGDKVGRLALGSLAKEWLSLPRKRAISQARITYATGMLNDFVGFIRSKYPRVKELADISPEMAKAFMARLESENVSGRTYNEALSLLRSTFEHIRVKAGMLTNPFRDGLITKDVHTIHRQPFSVEELDHLILTAKACDGDVHDLIVLGACTALRLGDAACLKWADVNLPANRIRVTTSKTGGTALLPIFPRLRSVLELRHRSGAYVFPELADLYARKRWELTDRINRVFKRAGFGPENEQGREPAPILDVQVPDDDEVMRKGVLAKIDALGPDAVSPKIKGTMREVFDLYSSGCTLPDIRKMLGISQGAVSLYLKRIRDVAGHPIIRKEVQQVRDASAHQVVKGSPVPVRRDGKGKIRINNRGFHALRATFTTQALAAGVPVEMVKLITGHTITETVLKHYFNPDDDMILEKMQRAMPRQLTQAPEKSTAQEILDILDNASGKTWKKDAERVRALVARLDPASSP